LTAGQSDLAGGLGLIYSLLQKEISSGHAHRIHSVDQSQERSPVTRTEVGPDGKDRAYVFPDSFTFDGFLASNQPPNVTTDSKSTRLLSLDDHLADILPASNITLAICGAIQRCRKHPFCWRTGCFLLTLEHTTDANQAKFGCLGHHCPKIRRIDQEYSWDAMHKRMQPKVKEN
jgi:hypothetical protein